MSDDKLPGGVVNDGCITPFSKLIQELCDQHRLARSGVTHYQEMMAFVLAAHADDFLLRRTGPNANSISASHLVKACNR